MKEEIEKIYNRMLSDFESFTRRLSIEDVEKDIKHAEEVEKKLKTKCKYIRSTPLNLDLILTGLRACFIL